MPTMITAPFARHAALPAARDFIEGVCNRSAALLLIVLLGPLMLLVAWLIWRRDGAPVLFSHLRVGRDGELFQCLKFRTMVRDSDARLAELLRESPVAREEWNRDQKLHDDPRITPVGRFLRRTSLDELPQLFNVVRGEMNLVGPRPIVVAELRRYGGSKFHYLSVKPGMTGLWQVSGRQETTYDERVRLDRTYVEQRSFRFDCMILARTVGVVLRRDGV